MASTDDGGTPQGEGEAVGRSEQPRANEVTEGMDPPGTYIEFTDDGSEARRVLEEAIKHARRWADFLEFELKTNYDAGTRAKHHILGTITQLQIILDGVDSERRHRTREPNSITVERLAKEKANLQAGEKRDMRRLKDIIARALEKAKDLETKFVDAASKDDCSALADKICEILGAEL